MKHLAWDFDGTIIDSFPASRHAMAHYCTQNDLPVPSDDSLKDRFKNGCWKEFEVWKLPHDEQRRHILGYFEVFYRLQQESPDLMKIIHGMHDLLAGFHAEGVVQSIVTSRSLAPLEHMIDHLGVGHFFSHYNSRDCANQLGLQDKPSADKLIHVMQQLGVEPENTVVIGDTVMDIKMARDANAKSIGVTWGIGTEEELKDAGADFIAQDVRELEQQLRMMLA